MKRLDLYSRTRQIQRRESRKWEAGDHLKRIKDSLCGEIISCGKNSILVAEQWIPENYIHGSVPLHIADTAAYPLLPVLFPALTTEGSISLKDLLFFDVETTGLSGGAGTYIFLVGFLTVEKKGLRIRQYFLSSLSSERLFLEQMDKDLFSHDFLVSYNGRSFDYNVIKNRYIMNQLPLHEPEPIHLDLLHTSRRVWKGLYPDFSLHTVEEMALRFKRTDDIPGWQVPEVYSRYLRGIDVTDNILRVFSHNRRDVLSLLALLLKQLGVLEQAAKPHYGANKTSGWFNPTTLSDIFLMSDRKESARNVLTLHRETPEALKRLALLYKREHDFDNALSHFKLLSEKGVDLSDYLFACIEVAKIYEHVYRDFEKALYYTEKMMKRVERAVHLYPYQISRYERERDMIKKRRNRLIRRLGRGIVYGEI